ncbi:MAG TPA: IS1595 family transposase [Stellaceae bacterium]|nr:IS1595 family transposase [Stellaceae bacterium]
MAHKKTIHQMTIAQWEKAFPDEDACCAYLVGHRWPNGVRCPRCGSERVYDLKTRKWHWECPDCREGGAYRFSHLVGTIFENTNKPLRDWFRVIHMMLTSKKGVSALQVHRTLGYGSYETSLYMCHRIRAGLIDKDFKKLMGIVEVDETFVGGKAKNRHKDKRGDGSGGTGGAGKAVVAGAVSRKGNVVARVVDNVRADTLTSFIRETVSTKVSLLCTDKWVAYKYLHKEFPQHAAVDHAKGEYVVGAVHTQTIEGFWSLVKRGIVGTFHKVSPKYLPLYVAEFQFRYNNRENADIFGAAISGV